MQQMYLIEVFVDTVIAFTEEDKIAPDKNLIVKMKWGPKMEFVVRGGQLAETNFDIDETIELTENGRKQWSRPMKVGRSYLFPSFPDVMASMMEQFPLEVDVWTDDEYEDEPPNKIYVGIGSMRWNTAFFHYIRETALPGDHKPISLKERLTLLEECCCKEGGEIHFILRLSALGDSIITEFQQLLNNPERFCFKTNKAPSKFECRRVEADDPKIRLAEPPKPINIGSADKKQIEICTELDTCGLVVGGKSICDGDLDLNPPAIKKLVTKIRMGDIVGPCGNTSCPLAHKVRAYIRHMKAYKAKAGGIGPKSVESAATTSNICGSCSCKDDNFCRQQFIEPQNVPKVDCTGCGGKSKEGDTCQDRKNKFFGTECTPRGSKTKINYVTKVPDYKDAIYRHDYIVQNCVCLTSSNFNGESTLTSGFASTVTSVGFKSKPSTCKCCNIQPGQGKPPSLYESSVSQILFPYIYNVALPSDSTPKPNIPNNPTASVASTACPCNSENASSVGASNCNCKAKMGEKLSRKGHRPYCPNFKHKPTCPIEKRKARTKERAHKHDENSDEDDDAEEPLPYGLPRFKLEPCPVPCKPCSQPDGYARMYKADATPAPCDKTGCTKPSSTRISCSKEYELIKEALEDYLEKHDEYAGSDKCCDKEQDLKSLLGRKCCGAHVVAGQSPTLAKPFP